MARVRGRWFCAVIGIARVPVDEAAGRFSRPRRGTRPPPPSKPALRGARSFELRGQPRFSPGVAQVIPAPRMVHAQGNGVPTTLPGLASASSHVPLRPAGTRTPTIDEPTARRRARVAAARSAAPQERTARRADRRGDQVYRADGCRCRRARAWTFPALCSRPISIDGIRRRVPRAWLPADCGGQRCADPGDERRASLDAAVSVANPRRALPTPAFRAAQPRQFTPLRRRPARKPQAPPLPLDARSEQRPRRAVYKPVGCNGATGWSVPCAAPGPPEHAHIAYRRRTGTPRLRSPMRTVAPHPRAACCSTTDQRGEVSHLRTRARLRRRAISRPRGRRPPANASTRRATYAERTGGTANRHVAQTQTT